MFETLHPKEFYRKFLEASVRPCGRGLSTARRANVSWGSLQCADGSSIARVGNTTVACGLKLEVGTPEATAPKTGRLAVDVILSPLCSTRYQVGRQCDEAVSCASRLQSVVEASKMLDFEQLCIDEGKSVWVIYADIVCLNHDGNIFDACMMALVSALQDLRLPDTEVEDDGEVVVTQEKAEATTRLALMEHAPVALSFALLEGHVLADPNAAEEALSTGSITLTYTADGKLLGCKKTGGKAISQAQLQRCMELASARARTVGPLLKGNSARGGKADVLASASVPMDE